ncbi:MAG: hypothetical protein ACTTH8_06205 [Treponema sp.]
MRIKTIYWSILLLCFLGIHAYTEQLLVHKTTYFDIIYSAQSEKTAALIAEHADTYAEEIAGKMNKKIWVRMPVYIAANQQVLNGYFTFFPYSRIVIFDTLPEEGLLTNFTDIILKVFYHELTHALSLIYFLPVLPLSFNEGAAVLYESLDGQQGRLNDPLLYHHLIQGKIDGVSPSWQEAAGQRDVYPGALWGYLYGAGFADYLQKNYGMEVYSRYWKSSFFIFPAGKTNHIFGKRLKHLWSDFIQSIAVPEKVEKPIPFLKKTKKAFTITASNGKGAACFDFASKEVWFVTPDGNQQKLFNANPTLSHLSFSQDGSLLLVTDIIQSLQGDRYRCRCFSMQEKCFLPETVYDIRSAAFCGTDRICGVKTEGQYSRLITRCFFTGGEEEILNTAGPGLPYTAFYSPVFAGTDKIAYIAANGLQRDILIVDRLTKTVQKMVLKTPLYAIRYLQTNNSAERPILLFSWAEKNMLYRAAYFDITAQTLGVLEKDISGGVFFPVLLPDNAAADMPSAAVAETQHTENAEKIPEDSSTALRQQQIIYAGIHGKYTALYTISPEVFTKQQVLLQQTADNTLSAEQTAVSLQPQQDILKPQKYRMSSWIWRVFPILYAVPPADLIDWKQTGLALFTYGIDPTTLVSFQNTSIFYFNPFFYQTHTAITINSQPVSFSVDLYDTHNNFRYRNMGGALHASLPIPFENAYRRITIQAGIAADSFAFFPNDYRKQRHIYRYKLGNAVLSDELSFRYDYLKTTIQPASYFFAKNTAGAVLRTGIKHGYHYKSGMNAFVLQGQAAFFMPVVPFSTRIAAYAGYNAAYEPAAGSFVFFGQPAFMGMASYLPPMTEHTITVTPSKTLVRKVNTGVSCDAEITFFSYEIQKGSSWLPIFYNRINISTGYKTVVNFLHTGSGTAAPDWYQSVYTKAAFTISGTAKIGFEYNQPLKPHTLGKFDLLFDVSF